MSQPCAWCGTDREVGVEGFCSEDCQRAFHTACQLWGESAYGAGTQAPEAGARCWRGQPVTSALATSSV